MSQTCMRNKRGISMRAAAASRRGLSRAGVHCVLFTVSLKLAYASKKTGKLKLAVSLASKRTVGHEERANVGLDHVVDAAGQQAQRLEALQVRPVRQPEEHSCG